MKKKMKSPLLYMLVSLLILALFGTAGAAALAEECLEEWLPETVEVLAVREETGEAKVPEAEEEKAEIEELQAEPEEVKTETEAIEAETEETVAAAENVTGYMTEQTTEAETGTVFLDEEGILEEECPQTEAAAGEADWVIGETETEPEEMEGLKPPFPEQMIVINPLYRDIYAPEDVFGQLEYIPPRLYASEGQTRQIVYLDQQQAVQTFREHLKNRDGCFTISLKAKSFDNYFANLYDAVFMHTGNPREGDYLFRQWLGMKSDTLDYHYANGMYYLTVSFTWEYFTTRAQEQQVDASVNQLKDSLGLNAPNKTDYEKITAIYDYMCKNITYDYANLNNDAYKLKYSAYAALIHKTAVCQGYALLFYRLALESGIDCRFVVGIDHAFNIVRLGNYYYNVDATWDSEYAGRYRYFLVNDGNMGTDPGHIRVEPFNGAEFYAAYPMDSQDFSLERVCASYGHEFQRKQTVVVPATCTETGKEVDVCSVCGYTREIVIPAHGHQFGHWVIQKEATCLKEGRKFRECTACTFKETVSIEKRKATGKTTASTVILKTRQSTSALKITGMAKGDYVKRWKCEKTGVVKVAGKKNGTCKLTALNKKGTTRLFITLASGKKFTVKVKVQKGTVKTTGITFRDVSKKEITLEKGKKYKLKISLTPITSQEKITYKTSNKKVAEVSGSGVIRARSKGKAVITVKSGKISQKCTVIVK